MFNDYELEQKENAFNYSKLRFERMDDFYTGKTSLFKDQFPFYSYVFITIARFINYKEEIWVKNKKTKDIKTNFSKEILDDFIFNGKFTNVKIDFRETRKKQSFKFNPVDISKILKGKDKDSIWIIDNIRDSIAHGHFYIDFNSDKLIIENNHEDRLLHCSIDLELFFALNELITEERIGGYSNKKLTTVPILYREQYIDNPKIISITNENQLRTLLKNEFKVSYSQVENTFETDENKKYNDLVNFYNFNVRLFEKIFNKFEGAKNKDVGDFYKKTIDSYIENKMKNYTIKVYNNHLDDEVIEKTIAYLKEVPNFYQRNIKEQGLFIHEILKTILQQEKIELENGVMDFVELYSEYALQFIENRKQIIDDLNEQIYSNTFSFKENKRLANLFILATNNFVCNKETIYDKYFDDYNEFNIDNFNYQDYSFYDKLINRLKVIDNDLIDKNNSLIRLENSKNIQKNNLLKAPKDKQTIIQNYINNFDIAINKEKSKINNLLLEKNNIVSLINTHKTDSNGKYINNNNKSFFNHLRNAFAHNHISYLDDNIVYNRKIVLEDYDDDNKLTFRCIGRYYDFVKLFNNELFLEAINSKKSKVKTLTK